MRVTSLRGWKAIVPLGLLIAGGLVFAASASLAAPAQGKKPVRLAIMTDCKGGFGFGYELDIGGAQAAFAQYAGGKVKNKNKPSAGMTGIKAGGTSVNIVGYGCGDDTASTAIKETRRLMEQLKADVMVGPLSGDEAVAIANYAKAHPKQTYIIGTAGSQDPTMQIAPKNMFRYHGDGAQWNAGIGEIAYKRLGWRNAAIIMDDYSFGWTSAAGMIADFCAIGGKITKRVFPPLNNADYAAFIRQLPAPDKIDGYFWAIGGNTPGSLTAFEQAYGRPDPKQFIGNLFFAFLGNDKVVAPKFVGSYVGGTGTAPGVKKPQMIQYRAIMKKNYPKLPADDLFVSNYFQAGKALVEGLEKSNGAVGAALQRAMPRAFKGPFQVSGNGTIRLDSRRQAIQDQYQLQLVKNKDGSVSPVAVAYVPNVDQSFGGLFKPSSPPPGRSQPACKKLNTPWKGKIRVVKNGVITNQVIK
jgi:branched-chain amino acid transport system substrate-binding protein